MTKQILRLLEFFEDDAGKLSISRLGFLIGLIAVIWTSTTRIDTIGEMTWGECVGRAAPGLVGLGAYIFGKLYDARTLIADTVNQYKNGIK